MKLFRIAFVAALISLFSASVGLCRLTGQLGILDLTANSGINPATGRQWQVGPNSITLTVPSPAAAVFVFR
jgi:hypothetical protein